MMLIGKRRWLRTVPRRLRLRMSIANIVGDMCLLAFIIAFIIYFAWYEFPIIVFSFISIILSCSIIFFQFSHRKATTLN